MTKINLEKCKKCNTENKGITLIALVITIVVLLILAGVTINSLTGSENAMDKATEAREKDKQGTELEAIKLAVVNSVASGLDGFVDTTALKSGLNGLIQENPEDVITGDSPWTVTSPSGRVYEINKNSIVNELTGLVLTPKSLTLTIEGDTYEEKTINARLIDIDGTLTWSASTDIIDVTPSADGKSATIKAKKSGTETVTVSCSNGDTAECAINVISMIITKIGDYIQYKVSYKDMCNTSINYTITNGWKILDISEETNSTGKYEGIKIISSGIPAQLYYYGYDGAVGTSWWDNLQTNGNAFKAASGLENKFDLIPLNGDNSMQNTGWYTSITVNNEDQGSDYNSNTGAIFLTNKALRVHNLTLSELNTATNIINNKGENDEGYRTVNDSSNIDNDLFKLSNSSYWLSTALHSNFLRSINTNGGFNNRRQDTCGLRPVVTLKPVTLTWNSTGSYWEVE